MSRDPKERGLRSVPSASEVASALMLLRSPRFSQPNDGNVAATKKEIPSIHSDGSMIHPSVLKRQQRCPGFDIVLHGAVAPDGGYVNISSIFVTGATYTLSSSYLQSLYTR